MKLPVVQVMSKVQLKVMVARMVRYGTCKFRLIVH